jgi:MutS domain V
VNAKRPRRISVSGLARDVRYNGWVKPHTSRLEHHAQRLRTLEGDDAREARLEGRVSLLRLAAFFGAAAALTGGVTQGSPRLWALSLGLGALFFAGVIAHARLAKKRRELAVRMAFQRHELARLGSALDALPPSLGRAPEGHPYAGDIDLCGPGSLLQRIDTTTTAAGEAALVAALTRAAELPLIRARQGAVSALADAVDTREALAVAGGLAQRGRDKLNHAPFFALIARPSVFATHAWLRPALYVGSALTAAAGLLVLLDIAPSRVLLLCALVNGLILYASSGATHATLSLLTARLGFAEAYVGMFEVLERHGLSSPHLTSLREGLAVQGALPSTILARLARLEGLAQLRTQGPLYIVLNTLTLWDLWCLTRIERFIADVGPHCQAWFNAVAELEVCAALAALHYADPSSTLPEVVEAGSGLTVEGLEHPLLAHDARVANDLSLPGPGSALVITGSNMAGKSTLLRALGLNVALALAGGPVCAKAMRIGRVRLRASMRIDDSLQRGASYFHAELSRLRSVVGELDDGPPVLFLLDELLRGTNAHARHKGARAVVLHLLRHRALGLVATHDIALSELAAELPGQVDNVHFTDVFEDGEMRFDYRLRPGVVKTSNALRLLALAGVDVEVDDSLGGAG